MIISNQTRAAIAVFTAIATTCAFTGCTEDPQNEESTSEEAVPSENETNAKLIDDNGNPYTLIKNQDGTETAKYDDGKEVTFKRSDDGGLDVVSGSAGLLAGLAAGYFLFHGMNYSGGSYSGNRYVPSSRPSFMSSYDRDRELRRYKEEKERRGGSTYVPINNSNSSTTTNSLSSSTTASKSSSNTNTSTTKSSTSTSNSNTSNSTSKSSVSSSPKGGFGSAGARSAAS